MKTLLINLQIFDCENDLMIETKHIKHCFENKNNINLNELYFDIHTHITNVYINNFDQNINDSSFNHFTNQQTNEMIENINYMIQCYDDEFNVFTYRNLINDSHISLTIIHI